MGPLFSMVLMVIAAGIAFSIAALVFIVFLPLNGAIRCAIGFAVGAGAGGALTGVLLALALGVEAELTGLQVPAYLATLALNAVLGGAALSWFIARKLPFADFAMSASGR
jgi:hypothetical protein